MFSSSLQAIVLGLAVTIIVLGAELLGLLDALELETIDLRFAHARWRDDPMSDQIRFVDIDDGAIESVGRWPWSRSTLADAIDELRRAGARMIALDILFEDAQDADRVDHDAVLAETLARARCVLVVRAGEPVLFHRAWSNREGAEELTRLLDVLSADIQLDPDEAAQQARLTGKRPGRFRARPIEFKKAAADLALRRAAGRLGTALSYDEFVTAVAPNVGRHVAAFPERVLLRARWEQHESWQALQRFLRPPQSDGSYRDKAPLPAFARHAGMIGYANVNVWRDSDGELRSVPPTQPARGGTVLQFGLAAAALHLGVDAHDVRVSGDHVGLGSAEITLDRGRVPLAWPTTETDWSGVLRRAGSDRSTPGRVSIAALVSLTRQRRALARNREHRRELARLILNRERLADGPLSAEVLREVDDEVEFQLESVRELREQGEVLTDEERVIVSAYERWPVLRTAILEGEPRIEAAGQRLASEMADRLVFVGMTATGAGDLVRSPLGAATPGVVAHAVVADMVLGGRWLRLAPGWVGWSTALLLGVLCTLLSARLPPAVATASVLAILGVYVVATGWIFGQFLGVLPLVAPVAAGAGSWIACTALGAALLQRDRTRITRWFRTRVSPQLVEYLLENPGALSVAGEPREVTAMFLDIDGFTAITEAVEVPLVVRALNQCMNEFTGCITRHGGYVNKFLGDGLMAFWSAFREDEHQASRACTTALECGASMERLNEREAFAGLPAFSIRIGIATGRAIVGDCGAPPHLNDYTVIGNGINLASRLESANKQFDTSILVDERTRGLLAPAGFRTRPIGRLIVSGQTVPVMVHELLPPDADEEMIDLVTEAVEAFLAKDYDASARTWKKVSEARGSRTLARFYLDAIADPDAVVDGSLKLRGK